MAKTQLPSASLGLTTELSTKAIALELQKFHPGSEWRFFYEADVGQRLMEISHSGRRLSHVLPPPSQYSTSVTLLVQQEEEYEDKEGHSTVKRKNEKAAGGGGDARRHNEVVAKDDDLLQKLLRLSEAPDDPIRPGEKTNAKRKLEQYLKKHPEMLKLMSTYRAKLQRQEV